MQGSARILAVAGLATILTVSCGSHQAIEIPPDPRDGKIVGYGDLYSDYKPLNEPAAYPPEVAPQTLLQFADVGDASTAELINTQYAPLMIFYHTIPISIAGSEHRVYRINGTEGTKFGVATFDGEGPHRELVAVGEVDDPKVFEAISSTKPGDWETVTWQEPPAIGRIEDLWLSRNPRHWNQAAEKMHVKELIAARCGRLKKATPYLLLNASHPPPGMSGSAENPWQIVYHLVGSRGSACVYLQAFTTSQDNGYAQKLVFYPQAVTAALEARRDQKNSGPSAGS
ncbi:hypothetical protein BH09SUM1_BH09SUM1_29810 [soil metagenome]